MAVLNWLIRGTSIKASVALLGVGLLALFNRGLPWQGEWAWTVDWVNGSTILSGPLAAGLAAYEIRRVNKPDWQGLSRSLPNGLYLPLHAMAAVWVVATCVHVAVMIVGVGLTWSTSPTGSFPYLLLILGPMVLAAFTAVGGIIAVLIPTIAAVPVAIIGTFALTYLAATGAVANVFRVGGVTGSVVGLEVNSGAVLIVAAFLVALSALLVLIVMALFTSVVGRSHVAVLSLSLIISLLAYVSLEFVGDERFRVSASAPRYICAGTGPEVCMLEGTTRQLAPLAKEMQRQADVLQAIGVKLPATYAQEHPRLRANKGQGVMYMTVDAVNVGKVDPATVSDYLSTPAACDEYYGDFPPKDALAARALVADLVRDRVGIAEFPAPTGSAENAWANSVFANEWLVATFHSLRECTLDAIKPPL